MDDWPLNKLLQSEVEYVLATRYQPERNFLIEGWTLWWIVSNTQDLQKESYGKVGSQGKQERLLTYVDWETTST